MLWQAESDVGTEQGTDLFLQIDEEIDRTRQLGVQNLRRLQRALLLPGDQVYWDAMETRIQYLLSQSPPVRPVP